MNFFKRINSTLVGFQEIILFFGFPIILGIMLFQVLTRYVFKTFVLGTDELAGHCALWLYFFGAAYGSYEQSHIKAEFARLIVKKEKILVLLNAITAGLSVVVSSVMAKWSYDYVVWAVLTKQKMPSLKWPTFYFQLPIFLGFLLMTIYFFVELKDYSRKYLDL